VIYDRRGCGFASMARKAGRSSVLGPACTSDVGLGGFGDGRKGEAGSGWFEGYLRSLSIRQGTSALHE